MISKEDKRMRQCSDCLSKKKLGKALEDTGFVCLDCLHKRAEMVTVLAHQVEKAKNKSKRYRKQLEKVDEKNFQLRQKLGEEYRKSSNPPREHTWALEVLHLLYGWTHSNEHKGCGCPMEIIDIMKSRGF